jgi:NADPH:quinone reductase-like Zn-dependent oxidoreductase
MKTIASTGGLAALQLTDLPDPTPGAGQVRVRMQNSAVNPADNKVLQGEFVGNILHGKQQPLVVGYDVSGTIDALGPGVDGFRVGDDVFGFLPYARGTKRGAYAELVVVAATNLALRPPTISAATGAAIATAGVTALQSLRDQGRLQAGQRVLIVGASGGVGALAVAIAKRLGAEVTGICSAAATDLVKSLGATHVRDRKASDVLGGDTRFDVVFDAAAAHSWFATRHLLAPGGTYVSTLPGPGVFAGTALAPLTGTRCRFIGVVPMAADLQLLAGWVVDGMPVPIDSTFPVRDLGAALERQARGGMRGRVVVEVAGGF